MSLNSLFTMIRHLADLGASGTKPQTAPDHAEPSLYFPMDWDREPEWYCDCERTDFT